MKVVVKLQGQDQIEAEKNDSGHWKVTASGCYDFLNAINTLVKLGPNPEIWPLPEGDSHVDLLLREFIMKVRGEWDFPYKDEETCHCRIIPTSVVDHAIINGAHHTAQVSRETSASTACGTCRPDVQKMIDYRLRGHMQAQKKAA